MLNMTYQAKDIKLSGVTNQVIQVCPSLRKFAQLFHVLSAGALDLFGDTFGKAFSLAKTIARFRAKKR